MSYNSKTVLSTVLSCAESRIHQFLNRVSKIFSIGICDIDSRTSSHLESKSHQEVWQRTTQFLEICWNSTGIVELWVDGILENVGIENFVFTLFVISFERCPRPCNLLDWSSFSLMVRKSEILDDNLAVNQMKKIITKKTFPAIPMYSMYQEAGVCRGSAWNEKENFWPLTGDRRNEAREKTPWQDTLFPFHDLIRQVSPGVMQADGLDIDVGIEGVFVEENCAECIMGHVEPSCKNVMIDILRFLLQTNDMPFPRNLLFRSIFFPAPEPSVPVVDAEPLLHKWSRRKMCWHRLSDKM